MSNIKHWIFVVSFFALIACEKQADLGQPVKYLNNGISFSLPGNWSVTEDSTAGGFRYLFVETPGDAIIFIYIYPKENSPPLREFALWAIESSVQELPLGSRTEGNLQEVNKIIGGRTYTAYKNEFVVSLLGINVPHITEFYGFQAKTGTAYISSQVATEDLSKVQEGFELVVSTFNIQ